MTKKIIRKRKPGGGRKPKGGKMVSMRLSVLAQSAIESMAKSWGCDATAAVERAVCGYALRESGVLPPQG